MLALMIIMDNSLLFNNVFVMFIMMDRLDVDIALFNELVWLLVNRHELVLRMLSYAVRLLFYNGSGGVIRCFVDVRIVVRHFFLVSHHLVMGHLVMGHLVMRSFLVHNLGLFNILVVMLRSLMEVIRMAIWVLESRLNCVLVIVNWLDIMLVVKSMVKLRVSLVFDLSVSIAVVSGTALLNSRCMVSPGWIVLLGLLDYNRFIV